MPKARTTCTRCSMRRQKCDRKQPCSRCVQSNEADSCTRSWDGGYDARIHRAYPKSTLPNGSLAASHSPTARSSSPVTAREHRTIPGTPTSPLNRQASRPHGTIADNSINVSVLTGIHTEATADEDVRNFDHYARFRHNEMSYLQGCLPNHLLLFQLMEYHEKYLLWHHNSLHGPTFQKEVLSVLHSAGNGNIQFKDLDLRWCALLFAVLSASLTCATEKQAKKWNLSTEEKQHYSKKWHEAATECLVLGEFASKPHIYSIQTIQILALSALILGLSNQQFMMLGAAVRMAQSLGLQRLTYDGKDSTSEDTRIHRETCRRVWWNLAMQDWFSISSYDMSSIHPQHFTSPRPRSHHDAGAESSEDEALIHYTNHVLDVAVVMVEFHMATVACTDVDARYEQVLKHDARLRRIDSREVHPDSAHIPWLAWAKSVSRVVLAHKMIILHRRFLGASFRNAAYAYTRWASIEASKLIVREVEQSFADPERPSVWNDQAHLTGAGVTLCLDAMHRQESEPEHAEHLRLVDKVMSMLAGCKHSVLASRGHRLLSSMLKEVRKDTKEDGGSDIRRNRPQSSNETESMSWPIENRETIDAMRTSNAVNEVDAGGQVGHPTPVSQRDIQSPAHRQNAVNHQTNTIEAGDAPAMPSEDTRTYGFDLLPATAADEVLNDASWTEMLSEFFPDQLGFGNALDFDDLFSSQYQT
ncbi:hypothetical protein M409DRAFT_48351 [Zasmidium cellare ATCC 36951]|uniref:Zn(2)-C6 fungal-type domain-containing protein n=1 Tax=Zasmidium cellare ATCC 36951 TaxID=1080233 RepID=A0A6A6D2N8_ZASCE|nr:uncharacterized protein M409DRAFT_48351 [Zasmidium cellare ATCC 36951]KAF2173363.1 hypothetical protein M409DRAFT_48351 [Zasmidium cellare ATCC 36951]